jgi:hypothetical protein
MAEAQQPITDKIQGHWKPYPKPEKADWPVIQDESTVIDAELFRKIKRYIDARL